MCESGEVVSSRRMPDEWPELMVLAEAALPETGSIPKNSPEARAIVTQAAEWDKVTLDQNRFYAYNQMLCGVARRLANSSTRKTMIAQGAQSLLDWSSKDRLGNGGISGLRHNSVATPFKSVIAQESILLTPEVQLIGDLLTAASQMRGDTRPSPDEIAAQVATTREDGSRMNDLISNVMTGATTNLLDTVLVTASPEYRDGEAPNDRAMRLLRHPRLPEIAQHACGLLLENTTAQAGFIQIDGDEIIFINPNSVDNGAEGQTSKECENSATATRSEVVMPGLLSVIEIEAEDSPTEDEADGYNSRNHSIICPAANIKGMVPGVVNMVVEMVEVAVEELKAEEAEHQDLLAV